MATQDHWAFLLQHEGDRNWLPLDTPDGMTIGAGRYRMIARSRRYNAPVEIRIAHTSPAPPNSTNSTDAPPRRTKKRTAKTNEKGFLLVLSYTDMQPGLWEFRCGGDVMSELLGQSWHYSIQLNVQPARVDDGDTIGADAPIVPAVTHPIATIDPVAAELENIFTPSPPAPPIRPAVNDPIGFGDDAISLEELFGPTSTSLGSSDDLASELAALTDRRSSTIGQPAPDAAINLESDLWAMPIDDRAEASAMTQLEVVSDDDETLLDWDASSLRRDPPPEPVVANPITASNEDGDDFRMFDELFATPLPDGGADTADIAGLDALLSADDARSDDDADVITFTDVDALAVTAETDHPIDLADPLPPIATDADWLPSVWGMGIRTGANAQIAASSPIATPANVAALIDASDILPVVIPAAVISAAVIPAAVIPAARQDLPPLTIALDPSFYNFQGGTVLMVYGQVVAASLPASLSQGELRVKLIDPQTATQVAEYRQPIDQQAFPLAIAAPLSIPSGIPAQLLLGEVALWDDGVEELAQQSFTAMALLDDLMASIDPDIVAEEFEKAPAVVKEGGDAPLPPVDFAFFNLIGDAPENAAELAPLKKRESMKDVELPGTRPAPGQIAPITPDVDDSMFSIDDLELENPLAPPTPAPVAAIDGLTSTSGQPLPDDWFDLAAVGEDGAAIVPGIAPGIAPEVTVEPVIAAVAPAPPEPEVIVIPVANPDPAASEVVVDDLPEALPQLIAVATAGNPLLIAADQPIPEPTIELVETGELVTGQTVRVRVKLPNILPKLYVKLWINDRQSRTLMDGPRWMVDFVPNGRDELETMTQLTVPFGSLEIQIAAIAVEAATKRESYRTVIDREVIPPNLDEDLEALSFDQF
jgi:hypothetical protein